jgi:LysM repeat protein
MLKKTLLLILCLIMLFTLPANRPVEARPSFSANDLIDAVNALRASNGLSPYKINNALMSSAQGQSDYQASIGEVTHTGSGGSRPYDRALAAGYGGGGTVIISENIAGGTNISAEAAVSMWQGDDPHLGTMLGPNYRDVGAGMAVSNNFVYFTLDAAYVAGGANLQPAPTIQGTPGTLVPTTAVPFVVPVKTATPSPDGSIVHIVEYGQTLYSIADAYKVSLDQLKALNKLSTTTIYVGEKLVVQASFTPTPTGQATSTVPTRAATLPSTRTPKPSTATAIPTINATVTPLPTPTSSPTRPSGLGNDPLLLLIIIMAAAGLLMMVAGSLLKRKSS